MKECFAARQLRTAGPSPLNGIFATPFVMQNRVCFVIQSSDWSSHFVSRFPVSVLAHEQASRGVKVDVLHSAIPREVGLTGSEALMLCIELANWKPSSDSMGLTAYQACFKLACPRRIPERWRSELLRTLCGGSGCADQHRDSGERCYR